MTRKTNRQAQPFIDSDGIPCVRVPLGKSGDEAIAYAEDYDKIIGAGISPYWFINGNGYGQRYVKAVISGNVRIVARVIARATANENVLYRNGNRCDLRRSNLHLEPKGNGVVKFSSEDLLSSCTPRTSTQQEMRAAA